MYIYIYTHYKSNHSDIILPIVDYSLIQSVDSIHYLYWIDTARRPPRRRAPAASPDTVQETLTQRQFRLEYGQHM